MSIRRERKDALEHRQLILRTAHELFSEHGVQPVSMHQIAKTAGIGQATLYRRYAHKGDLCLDMLYDYSHQLMNRINVFLEEHRNEPPAFRLGGIVDHWVDAIEEKADLIIAMEARMSCEDDRGSFFHSPMYRFFRDRMSEIISEMLCGDSQLPIDTDLAAHTIICSLSPIGYFHVKQEKAYTVEQIKQHFRRLFAFYSHSRIAQ